MQNLCISLPSWLSFRFGFVPKKQFLWKPVRPNVLPENQIKSSPTGLRRDNSVSNVLDRFICHLIFYHPSNFKIPLTGPAPNTANSCQRKLCPKCWTNQTWWNSWNLLGLKNTDPIILSDAFGTQNFGQGASKCEREMPNVKITIRKIIVYCLQFIFVFISIFSYIHHFLFLGLKVWHINWWWGWIERQRPSWLICCLIWGWTEKKQTSGPKWKTIWKMSKIANCVTTDLL